MQIRYNLKQDPTVVKIAIYEIWYNNKNINNDETTTVTRDKIINIIKLAPPDATICLDQQNLMQKGFALCSTYQINIKVTDINKQDTKTVVINDLKLSAREDEHMLL